MPDTIDVAAQVRAIQAQITSAHDMAALFDAAGNEIAASYQRERMDLLLDELANLVGK